MVYVKLFKACLNHNDLTVNNVLPLRRLDTVQGQTAANHKNPGRWLALFQIDHRLPDQINGDLSGILGIKIFTELHIFFISGTLESIIQRSAIFWSMKTTLQLPDFPLLVQNPQDSLIALPQRHGKTLKKRLLAVQNLLPILKLMRLLISKNLRKSHKHNLKR